MILGLVIYAFLKGRIVKTFKIKQNSAEPLKDLSKTPFHLMGGLRSWSPIILLTVVGIIWFYTPVYSSLEGLNLSLIFPSFPPVVSEPIHLNLVDTQGTVILIATVFAWSVYGAKASDFKPLVIGAFKKWWPMSLITGVGAAISSIFVQSGMGILIVKGLAHLPGPVTAFLTPWLALFGTLTVGGGAPTNFLFGPVAWNIFSSLAHNPALYTSVINMTGGGFAYSLSPSFIIGPVAIAGILGQEGRVWRKLAGVIFLTTFLFSIEVLLLYVFGI